MAIEMVRIPSETPNISNTDDFVGLRYAYGNQNGYVIGKGQECSYTINGSKFRVNSGRLVLQGVECDIDANGVEITIDNVTTTRYYTVYLQVNLAINEAKILAKYDNASYPNIDTGDDLTANTTGTARMKLYTFRVDAGDGSSQSITFNYFWAEPIRNYYGEEIWGVIEGGIMITTEWDNDNTILLDVTNINKGYNLQLDFVDRRLYSTTYNIEPKDSYFGTYIIDTIIIPFKDNIIISKRINMGTIKETINDWEIVNTNIFICAKIINGRLYLKYKNFSASADVPKIALKKIRIV